MIVKIQMSFIFSNKEADQQVCLSVYQSAHPPARPSACPRVSFCLCVYPRAPTGAPVPVYVCMLKFRFLRLSIPILFLTSVIFFSCRLTIMVNPDRV